MPTASATTSAEITAQLNAWASAPIAGPGIINLAAGDYAALTLTQNLAYPVQIIGPANLTAVFNGTKVTFNSGANNIFLEEVIVLGTTSTSGSVSFNAGVTNCGIRKSQVIGITEAAILAGGVIPNSYGVYINGANFIEISECFISGFKLPVNVNGGNNQTIQKSFFRYCAAVAIQGNTVDTVLVERNFIAYYFVPTTGGDTSAHGDYIFFRQNKNLTVRKNVAIRANDSPNGTKISRGIVAGDNALSTENCLIEQNMLMVNNPTGIQAGQSGVANTNGTVRFNSLFVADDQPNTSNWYTLIQSAMATLTKNGNAVMTKTGAYAADSGGKIWDLGSTYAGRNYASWLVDFTDKPVLACNLSKLIPKNTSQLYPGVGTVGAYDLIADLLAGNHPAAWAKAVKDPFNLYMNTDGFFTPASANIPPVANPDSGYSTPYNTPLVLAAATLLANDTDGNSDTLTVVGVGSAVGGTVGLVGTTITFTPTPGFSGAASFVYTASDGTATAPAPVSLTVGRPQMKKSIAATLSVPVTVG